MFKLHLISKSPVWIQWKWLLQTIRRIIWKIRFNSTNKNYKEIQKQFRYECKNLSIDNDWFTLNIPSWLRVLNESGIKKEDPLKILEIGSWQGLSSNFLVSYFPNSRLTCVDTWEGADEHKLKGSLENKYLHAIEKTFDQNLSQYLSRLEKYKGTSLSYFANNTQKSDFDLIYIDGSHNADDVLIDAISCFNRLKVGGVMIFDDYFWRFYPEIKDNPIYAINSFLNMKKNKIRIVGFDYQISIIKIGI